MQQPPNWQQPPTQYPPQQPYYPPQEYPHWQPPVTPPPMPMQPRAVRMQVKVACLICFGLAFMLAMMGVPFLTLVAGIALLAAFVLVFLI